MHTDTHRWSESGTAVHGGYRTKRPWRAEQDRWPQSHRCASACIGGSKFLLPRPPHLAAGGAGRHHRPEPHAPDAAAIRADPPPPGHRTRGKTSCTYSRRQPLRCGPCQPRPPRRRRHRRNIIRTVGKTPCTYSRRQPLRCGPCQPRPPRRRRHRRTIIRTVGKTPCTYSRRHPSRRGPRQPARLAAGTSGLASSGPLAKPHAPIEAAIPLPELAAWQQNPSARSSRPAGAACHLARSARETMARLVRDWSGKLFQLTDYP